MNLFNRFRKKHLSPDPAPELGPSADPDPSPEPDPSPDPEPESGFASPSDTALPPDPEPAPESPFDPEPTPWPPFDRAPSPEPYAESTNHPHMTMTSLPVELQYLESLIRYRLEKEFQTTPATAEPPMPPYDQWQLPIGHFITEYNAANDALTADEARLLLIGLAYHVQPDLFDRSIDSMLKGAGDFPRIGGARGKNFRGFIPTGETALFLLAGDDWQKRLAIQQLFWADHVFARRKMLWLEDIVPGEPAMSGKITLSQDYVEIFTHNKPAPPHYSMQFPAKLISTDRERKHLVINQHLDDQIEDLLDWIKFKGQVTKGADGRFRNGYRCLFYGPSGTGKTFAACILGKETGKEVYRVDLSMVVSKYIGETEKNLEVIFARAENKRWILFFDEAEAIFSKRTNIRDAHDKYANQEVAYLLQRIEDYDGLVILATNMKNNIDEAFIRRFNAVLKFSMPEPDERKQIWQNTFSKNVKYKKDLRGNDADMELDIPEIVKKYALSGANIENIVHYASIKGAKRQPGQQPGDPQTIYLPDVIDGIKLEYSKDGIPFAKNIKIWDNQPQD